MGLKRDVRGYVILLLVVTAVAKVGSVRPEIVLADVLTKPFVPLDWARPECIRDGKIYLKELEKYTPWALQMYDSSAKISPGVITGNYKQLGNFDECLRVVSNDGGFVGQACHAAVNFEIAESDDGKPRRELDLGDLLVNVAIASNATKWKSGSTVVYEWMWCVPSTCNHSEIEEALEIALDPLKVEGRVDVIVNVPKESCHTVETVRATWDIADWCYTTILILFGMIIIASTGYDVATERGILKNAAPERKVILASFSLYTNGKNLLRTDRHPEFIGCIDGLRFLSTCWIICGHTYYMQAVGVKINLTQIVRMHYEWGNMLILNGNIATDIFFLLSGIVLAYTELSKKQRDPNWRFNVIGSYIRRYVRLTPAYAMMIGFYATLFVKLGSGLYWDTWVGSNKQFCRENWWTNLLYVNNYVNVTSICMSQSWYLSTDMQLTWLSPIFLYPLLKLRGRVFAIIFGIGLFISILVPFLITYTLELTGTMLYYKKQTDVIKVYLEIYTRVYNRFGPYIIGLALGYLLHTARFYEVKLRTSYVIFGWLLAIVTGMSIVLGPRRMYFDDYVYNRLEASLYAGFHRQVFALAISWIIFCCVQGYAGPVNQFLSWNGWMPLSKLTYCAYLSHYVFLLTEEGAVRTAGTLTLVNVVRAFFGNLIFTMMLSAVWYLCFEMPFMVLDRALFRGSEQKSSEDTEKKGLGSVIFGKEIFQSKNESAIAGDGDNYGTFSVARCDSTEDQGIVGESDRNKIEFTKEETEANANEVYVVDPTDLNNKQLLDESADNSKCGYINYDFYNVFDKQDGPRMSTKEKRKNSIDANFESEAKTSRSLENDSRET